MDILNFLKDHWHIITAIIALTFVLGKIMQKMTTYLNADQVENIVDKKFSNHCPFTDKIAHLETTQAKNIDNVAHIKAKLDQIDFNVQNICDKLDVQYIGKKNGS